MTGASLEATLALWSQALCEAKGRMQGLFGHASVVASAGAYLDSLLGSEPRKTGWTRAERVGDVGPWRQQAVLGRSRWDADALRDVVRDYALETLADRDGVLVIDETGFLKQGKASCGVGRQYTGSAGKITNCQIGVFAAYVSRHGHALVDRRLYLPKIWTADPARCAATRVPASITFATKPQIAAAMIARALETEMPFAWVAADAVYGVGDVEMALRHAGKGYVLGVTGQHHFWSWSDTLQIAGTAEAIAAGLEPSSFKRLSAGDGTKGPRLHDWAYLPLADIDAVSMGFAGSHGLWTRGLLVRRSLADQSLAYFTTWCPYATPVETLVKVEGKRRAIEEAFETAKSELGLTHNESRSWHGWHRHVSLVMLAFAMLAGVRHRANAVASPLKSLAMPRPARSWSAGQCRKSAVSSNACAKGASSLLV